MFKHSHPHRKKLIPSRPMVVQETEVMTEEAMSADQLDENPGFTASSEEAPPKQRRKRGPNKNPSMGTRQSATIGQIESSLKSIIGMVVTATYFSGKPVLQADGQVVAQHSENLIKSILELCKQDKNVREFFLALSTSSAYGAVVVATLPIIIGILANHGLIPPLFGTPVSVNGNTNEAVPNAAN